MDDDTADGGGPAFLEALFIVSRLNSCSIKNTIFDKILQYIIIIVDSIPGIRGDVEYFCASSAWKVLLGSSNEKKIKIQSVIQCLYLLLYF